MINSSLIIIKYFNYTHILPIMFKFCVKGGEPIAINRAQMRIGCDCYFEIPDGNPTLCPSLEFYSGH